MTPYFDFSKLKGKIIEVFGSQESFCKAIGLSETQMSRLLSNKSKFTVGKIMLFCNKLGIPVEEIGTYFFKEKV